MLRWFFTIFFALVILSATLPWLERLGLGRLPGDVRFRLWKWDVHLPFASTVLLSLLVMGVAKWL